jgi:drug/metabolite transporter (DMT)-like permease
VVFVCLAAVRDVYLGGLFQRVSPLLVAMVAFTLCTLVLLPLALVHSRKSLVVLLRRPHDLLWVNVTSALAWLAFFYALRLIEPSLVQILYSGIGPLSLVWIDRHLSTATSAVPLTRAERPIYAGLLAALACAAAVALGGLSGTGAQPLSVAALGVMLAASGGIAISVSTMLCRTLSDAGVTPGAVLALRYPATALSAAVLASLSSSGPPMGLWLRVDAVVAIAALLIVIPSYVNQVGISLASPLTVRVVLATGPVLIFGVQLLEGRLSASPYSLMAALLYAVVAISAGLARQRAIRAAVPA